MLNGLLITVSGMEDTESTGIKKFLDAVNEGIIGSVAEFIVDYNNSNFMASLAKKMGDMNYMDGFEGKISKIRIEK